MFTGKLTDPANSGAVAIESDVRWSRESMVVDSDHIVGTGKLFNTGQVYGFLGHDSGDDVFITFSAIQKVGYRWLFKGLEVKF